MKLFDYLPRYLREIREFGELTAAEQPEFNLAVCDVEKAADDFYISSLSEYGCRRWESIMGIITLPGDSIEIRRQRIMVKYMGQLPYTYTMLLRYLAAFSADIEVWLESGVYTLHVRVDLASKSIYGDVEKLLHKIVPANMVIDLQILYNHYGAIGKFTHGELGGYTHNQLRNEVSLSA